MTQSHKTKASQRDPLPLPQPGSLTFPHESVRECGECGECGECDECGECGLEQTMEKP